MNLIRNTVIHLQLKSMWRWCDYLNWQQHSEWEHAHWSFGCRKPNTILLTNLLRYFFFLWCYSPNLGLGLPPWNSPFHLGLLYLRHSVGLLGRVISSSQGLYLYTNKEKRTHTHTQTLNIHAQSGIRTHDPGFRASEDSECLRPLGYRDRQNGPIVTPNFL
jgi:hypothetical protein